MPNNKLTFFNTDLRDGRQSPGCKMIDPDSGNIDPILEVAKQLDRTRYDVIEAGFPSAGEKESDIVKAVVQATSYSTIAAMARMANSKKPGHEYDCMNAAFKALEEAIAAKRGRITLLVSTAPLLRKYSLGMSKGEVIENAKTSGKYLVREFDRRKADPDVQFYLEGATDYLDATTIEEQKEELRFLIETARAFISSMALENNGKRDLKLTMSLPDTRGRAVDNEYGKLFEIVQEKIPEIHENGVILSAHAHNDFGLAVANTLQAVKAGARQIEVTTNGIGERTGNASAVPVALQLHYFGEKFGIKKQGLKMDELDTTAKLISKVTYDPIRRTEPGIGSNANSTAAGIHESAVAKDPKSYNFIDGKIVGAEPVLLILGPHSGKNALRSVLKEHGIMVSNAVFEKLAWSLKEETNRDMKPGRFFREFVSRPEIVKMMEADDKKEGGMFLEDEHFSYEKHNDRETVTLRVSKKGHTTPKIESSSHNGVVDAAKIALEKTLDKSMELHVYDPRTFGDDSGATVVVGLTLEMDGQMRRGYGMSADQNTAAVKAMLNALNHFEAEGFTAKLKKV